jgi:hypothetical protein
MVDSSQVGNDGPRIIGAGHQSFDERAQGGSNQVGYVMTMQSFYTVYVACLSANAVHRL